MKECFRHRNLA